MKIKIQSWNVRGANDKTKRKLIKVFLKTHKADVVCIQETKWRSSPNGIIRSLASSRYVDLVTSCFEGASGGIVILWDSRVAQLIGVEESSFTLSCRFKNCGDDFSWSFT